MPYQHPLRSIYGVSLASLGWLVSSGLMLPLSTPAHAQSIVEATDGTGTLVQIDNNIFSISGGTQSANDRNVFHSFQSFNLKAEETANFVSDTQIQNILGRVTGGDASIINGTLQVTGSDANLFLMNPAGFIFGADAQLNVPQDFTATTATGIGFEDRWFNAEGDNDYNTLTTDPTQFAFATNQPGSIFNEGTLAVNEEQTLMLMGGSVVNTGTLQAPNGLVMMTAVPGERLVQISRDDMVLTLEIEPLGDIASAGTEDGSSRPMGLNYTPLTLSQLLTGGQTDGHATSVEVRDDGSIVLADANTTIDADWAVADTDPSLVTLSDETGVSSTSVTVQTADANALKVTEVTAASFVAPTDTQGTVVYGTVIPGIQSTSDNPSPDNNGTDTSGVNDVNMDLPDDSILDNSDPDVDVVDDPIDSFDTAPDNEIDPDSSSSPLSTALPNDSVAPGPSSGAAPGPSSGAAPGPSSGAAPGPSSGAAPGPSSGALPNINDSPTIVSGTLSDGGSAPAPSTGTLPNAGDAPSPGSGALPNSDVGLPTQSTDSPDMGGANSTGPLESTITIDAGPSTLDAPTSSTPQSTSIVASAGSTDTPTTANPSATPSIQPVTPDLNAADGVNDLSSGTPDTTGPALSSSGDSTTTGSPVSPIPGDTTDTLNDDGSSLPSSTASDIDTDNTVVTDDGAGVLSAGTDVTLDGTDVTLDGTDVTSDGTDVTIDESNPTIDSDVDQLTGPGTTDDQSVELIVPVTPDSLIANAIDDGDTKVDVNVGPETIVPETDITDTVAPDVMAPDTAASEGPDSYGNDGETLNAEVDASGVDSSEVDSVAIASTSLSDTVVAGIKLPDDSTETNVNPSAADTSTSSLEPGQDTQSTALADPPQTTTASSSLEYGASDTTADLGTSSDGAETDTVASANVSSTDPLANASQPASTTTDGTQPSVSNSASSSPSSDPSTPSDSATPESPSSHAPAESSEPSSESSSESSTASDSPTTSPMEGESMAETDSSTESEGSTEGNGDRVGVPQYAFPHNGVNVAIGEAGAAIASLEQQRNDDLVSYFGRDLDVADVTPETVQTLLRHVNQQTGNRAAIVYVTAPQSLPYFTLKPDQNTADMADADGSERPVLHPEVLKQAAWKQDVLETNVETPLELLVFTLEGEPLRIRVPGVSREHLFATITQFRNDLVLSERRGTDHYLPTAQRLYQWLMAPLEAELGSDAVETFLFAMDSGLRGLPIAALHDGDQFVVEKYSVGMVPSLGVMNSQYTALDNADVLAMGAETFTQQDPLPAVPVEVNTITEMHGGRAFLNEAFTQHNLVYQQTNQPSQIIHLATHASFNPGTAEDSYIQLWGDEQLSLSEVQTLGWNNPSVDLLVLSACQTAVGNAEAEMGFAGLAVAAGVQSALASLWTINDEGTLALMTEFYDHLNTVPLKSEALRQSQLALLNGSIQIEDGHLVRGEEDGRISLPSSLGRWGDRDLSHPYYWSGFTMIGSPW